MCISISYSDEIIIVRVLHGSRDIASIADEGGFAI
jgi:plasmid stabilization system protein ParE